MTTVAIFQTQFTVAEEQTGEGAATQSIPDVEASSEKGKDSGERGHGSGLLLGLLQTGSHSRSSSGHRTSASKWPS